MADILIPSLSARKSTDCGMDAPICLAVFKFTTSSNFIGCSTGTSALGAFQNLVHVTSAISTLSAVARTVRHQAAIFRIIAACADRRQAMTDGQIRDEF